MRERVFRIAALVIGLLGIMIIVWQFLQAGPQNGLQLEFLSLQGIVMGVFIVYGLGIAFRTPKDESSQATPHTTED